MVRKILLCTDGSRHADTAAEYAVALATALEAETTALHVIDVRLLEGPYLADLGGVLGAQPYQAVVPKMQEIQQDRAELAIKAVEDRFHKNGRRVVGRIETGQPVRVILEAADPHDLVILGKRGESAAYAEDVIGSSVEWILRRTKRPCLVTPEKFRAIRKVVAAYDGSEYARMALEASFELVKKLDLALTIVTVAPEDVDAMTFSRNVLGDAMARAKEAGVTCTEALLRGHTDEKIPQYCYEHDADLLVIGAYGHGRIREFLLGSTTFQLLLKSEIPVLLTR